MFIGYEHLRRQLAPELPPRPTPARIAAVNAIGPGPDNTLAVPAPLAPAADDWLAHLLFALKHEGTDLLVLQLALRRIPESAIAGAVAATPSGQYVRKAGFLWERFNGRPLDGIRPTGNYVGLFDPARYYTGPSRRDARWRVDCNGLGTLAYCPTVRRTAAIETLLAADLPGQARAFADSIGPVLLDRALAWAYLSETESSFAIEREVPTANKTQAFAALLRQAGDGPALDEERLVALQNATITNPLEQAVAYRTQQNWLRGPARGAVGITYVPPPPALARELMDELLQMIETACPVDPLILAAVASFGFVFIHPFMDGNGRLSRFLVHHVLGRSGRLPRGFVLPVSVAMKRSEAGYLRALQEFSRPVRDLWDVRWFGEDDYTFTLRGDDAVYRYWDATTATGFLLAMTEQALQRDLREETGFLLAWDAALHEIEARYDIRGSLLSTLLLSAFEQDGSVSRHRRKQFADRVPAEAFDFIETVVRRHLPRRDG